MPGDTEGGDPEGDGSLPVRLPVCCVDGVDDVVRSGGTSTLTAGYVSGAGHLKEVCPTVGASLPEEGASSLEEA